MPISLQRPASDSLDPADRETIEAFYDSKLHQELELFEWAAAQHAALADWTRRLLGTPAGEVALPGAS